jgi:hypothetical protein
MGSPFMLVADLSALAGVEPAVVALSAAYLALIVVIALTAVFSHKTSRRAAALDVLRLLLRKPGEDNRRPTGGAAGSRRRSRR